MPRSPIVTKATRELAKYFQAITDAAFIDRSYRMIPTQEERASKVSNDPGLKIQTNRAIYSRALDYEEGTPVADHIANLINGSINFTSFYNVAQSELQGTYAEEFEFLQVESNSEKSPVMSFIDAGNNKLSERPSIENPNLYSVLVNNPYMGPATKDSGAIEIFMNAIPTLEFSKCVPYIGLEIVSLRRISGTTAQPLTLLGYLNPTKLGSADLAMQSGQETQVRSEVLEIGPGLRSGIELFTMPQTLANLGDTGPEFVPIIDRLRPLATLGTLTLNTKLQGGTLSFTTGKLEITIHDRSRLREVAAFVRPDLYGTTFLDITYGWSHPDGGVLSDNSYGKFLDALKTSTRYRVSNSSYSFEEGGQIKVTLSIQSVGTIDLLYLGPRAAPPELVEMQRIIRDINERLAELRARGTSPSMVEYDILDTFKDPASALRAGGDANVIKKLREALTKMKDSQIKTSLNRLVGSLTQNSTEAGGVIEEAQNALVAPYTTIVDNLPRLNEDAFAERFIDTSSFDRLGSMNDNKVRLDVPDEDGKTAPIQTKTLTSSKDGDVFAEALGQNDYVTYGSVFMEMIAKPIKNSKQYDEVQVIFYPFNQFAGAVHDLPISAFPIEVSRLKLAIEDAAKSSPELSARSIIRLLYDRFTHYSPSRAYLMAGFYTKKEDDQTGLEMEAKNLKETYEIKTSGGRKTIKVAANLQLTFEERLMRVGVPEAKFKMPVVEVAVEASPLLDVYGAPILDDKGNSKTLIKMHVYDAAMDPHSTLTDIISAAKDNELGVINIPASQYQSAVQSGISDNDAKIKSGVDKVISVGLETGMLEAVRRSDTQVLTGEENDLSKMILDGSVFLRVKASYDEIKRMVSAGMPTITYGSSMTALTNASLTTGGSAGLPNVMLQRAFSAPGETAAENVNTGVPMQLIPAQLSISTIGCPLFSPMQRFFVDFGTGTSIDNVYFVTSVDSNISREGYKTDVKMSFGEGFATYRSLNQKLAMMAANWADVTSPNGESGEDTPVENESVVMLSKASETGRFVEDLIKEASAELARLGAQADAALQEELTLIKQQVDGAKAAAKRQVTLKAQTTADAVLRVSPESVAKINELEAQLAQGRVTAGRAAAGAAKVAFYVDQLQQARALAATLPEGSYELYLEDAEAQRVKDEEARRAAAAAEKRRKDKKEKDKKAKKDEKK